MTPTTTSTMRARRVVARCVVPVLLAITTGCARTGSAEGASGDSSVAVTLERGPCRGFCPEYKVSVYENGRVQFDGRTNVSNVGARSATISTDAVRGLVRSFDSTGFVNLDSSYTYGRPVCGRYITDLPVVTVTAKVGARMKTVQHDPGCNGAPAFLRALEARIDSVAGTSAWITGKGEGAR